MRADASPSEGFMKKLKFAVGKDKKGKKQAKGKKKSMFGNMMKKKSESDDDGDEGM